MKSFVIRKFSGIETKIEAPEQDRGTLRRAAGVVPVPNGALSTGPIWNLAWGAAQISFMAGISGALTSAGADFVHVHFATFAIQGATFLIAYDRVSNRTRGCFHVAGTGAIDPSVALGFSPVAPSTSIYRNKTAGLAWYASYIDSRIILGNGTDPNLVWSNGALALFGPVKTPADHRNPAREAFPPCTCFCQDERGVIYGAGNATYPLRIYRSEIPSVQFPQLDGVREAASSYFEVMAASGTTITAIRMIDAYKVAVHLSVGGISILNPATVDTDGGVTRPAAFCSGAITPNCVRDRRTHPFFLGRDLEIYRVRNVVNPADSKDWRDTFLATDRSSGLWNVMLEKPATSSDYFTIYDEKNGRLWIFGLLTTALGGQGAMYCYDTRSFAVTGPWLYPYDHAIWQAGSRDQGQQIALAISSNGSLLYSDLNDIGERTLPDYTDPLGAAYAELSAAPVHAPQSGIPFVGVSADGTQFKVRTPNGFFLSLATPWSDFALADITATRFYDFAHLSVIELNTEDMGDPDIWKEFHTLQLEWARNTRAYVGVYVECDGRRSGKWRGLAYPAEAQVCGIACAGRRIRVRIIIVAFNDKPALLSSATIFYNVGASAH